jgi:hypothetical protein
LKSRACAVGLVALALSVVALAPGTAGAKPKVCPDNLSTDLYVNPDSSIKRKKKVELTGVSSPVECTFASITDAIEAAQARGLGAGARIILSGATPTAPAVFTQEVFPLAIPSGMTLTTSDDPGVGGGTDLNPANYVVRFGGSATHAVSVQGGGVKGITFKNQRSVPATAMVVCGAGTTAFGAVTLDG